MKPVDRLPENVRRLLRRIGRIGEDAGVRTYAVGGFVRDLILGVPNLDLDVTVEGDGRRFAEVLARKMGGDVISYDRFGTATLSLGEGPIERMDVVTARRERYPHPGALPEVEPATIREDLFRRDFTINAMAMALNPNRFGQIVDFYGGLRDLRGKIIRVMHDMSFIDDPTRLFRCVRFEARYDFTVEPHTSSLFRRAIDEGMPLRVSRQRIWHEMKLILAEDLPEKPIRRMSEVGLLRFISPDLEVSDETIRLFGRIRGALDLLRRSGVKDELNLPLVYLAAMISHLHTDAIRTLCRELSLSGEEERILTDSREVLEVKLGEGRSGIYRAFEGRSVESLLFLLAKTDDERVKSSVVEYLTGLRHIKPIVSGDDLKEMGLKPGPIFGEILREAFNAQLDGELRSRSQLRQFLISRGYIRCI